MISKEVESKSYHWQTYSYTPCLGTSIEFLLLFAVSMFFLIFQVCLTYNRHKDRVSLKKLRRYSQIMIPFIIGCGLESIGYVWRLILSYNTQALGPYIYQSLLLLIGPLFLAASFYMIFGEIIKTLKAEEHSIIPVKYLTKIFVIGDIISFLLQSAGVGIQAGGSLLMCHLGEKLILVGLFVQIAFFGIFIVSEVIFLVRCLRNPTQTAIVNVLSSPIFSRWTTRLLVLFVSSILIVIRSVFRVIEYAQGSDGYLISDEKYLLILDSAMISFSVMFIIGMNFTHWLADTATRFHGCFEDIELVVPKS